MSEAELHIIRQRMNEGKLNKARRGDLGQRLPGGYHHRPSGEVILDPDEGVRQSIEYFFDAFESIGTVSGLLRHLVANDVLVGGRVHTGPQVGDVKWRRPHRGLFSDMLRNPIYAGAYVHGRRQTDPRRQVPGRPATGRRLVPMEEWKVCIRDHYPAYITWERFLQNQDRLTKNRSAANAPGAPRQGNALLQGLVRCGRCGLRMFVQQGEKNGKAYARYVCNQDYVHYGGPRCQSLSASCIDDVARDLSLQALSPAALKISLCAAEDLQQERERADDLRKGRLERARYASELAARHYRAVDPDNRLVARTLEREWEEALRELAGLEEEYARHQQRQPRALSDAERSAIEALASEVPEIWSASTTTNADRKEILRLLIDEVLVTVDGDTEWVDMEIRWAGGVCTRRRVRRPVGRLSQLSRYEELLQRLRELRRAGANVNEIAAALNSEGWTTPTQRNTFNGRLVKAMMQRHGIVSVPRGQRPRPGPDEWWLSDLAKELQLPRPTLYGWLQRGLLRARRVERPPLSWAVFADEAELRRLKELRAKPTRGRRKIPRPDHRSPVHEPHDEAPEGDLDDGQRESV